MKVYGVMKALPPLYHHLFVFLMSGMSLHYQHGYTRLSHAISAVTYLPISMFPWQFKHTAHYLSGNRVITPHRVQPPPVQIDRVIPCGEQPTPSTLTYHHIPVHKDGQSRYRHNTITFLLIPENNHTTHAMFVFLSLGGAVSFV